MEAAAVSRALAATTAVASELGLRVDDAIVLHNSNRVAVRLVPCDVLARVAASVREDHDVAAFELEMGRRLADVALVGALEPRVEPIVHERDGFAITYWTYYDPLPAEGATPVEYAQALEHLHAGMRQLDVAAPHFTDRVHEAESIVGDRSQSPELGPTDRELLLNVLRGLRHAIVARRPSEQLLHGEPHAGNVLRTAGGLRFIDLQTCCRGPVEFDIAHAPDEVGDHYPNVDRLLLRDCRILMLGMVAAWRADRDDAFPDGVANRDALLGRIREALDRRGIDVRP